MNHVALGRPELKVSRMGFGCMGLAEFYGEPASQSQVDAVLSAALDAGITFFDTADMYGRGLNEEQVGPFVRQHRADVVLATKFGAVRSDDPKARGIDNSPEYVKAACDASLKRLGVEVIDLYYMHRRTRDVPIEESVGAMADLVTAGKVRTLGISEVSPDTLRAAHAVHPMAALQSEFSLTTRDVAVDCLPTCRELGIAYVAYSPLGRGLLSGTYAADKDIPEGDFRRHLPRFSKDNIARNLEPVEVLRAIAAEKSSTPAQIALAWVMAQGEDIIPIPGTTSPERVAENAAAAALSLTEADISALSEAFPVGAAEGDRYPEIGMQTVGT